jgi:hypothetical protein
MALETILSYVFFELISIEQLEVMKSALCS